MVCEREVGFSPQVGGLLRRVLDSDADVVRLIESGLPTGKPVTVVIEPNFRKPKRNIEGRDNHGHLTAEGCTKIAEMVRSGMSITDICVAMDVGRTTVYLIRRAQEETESGEASVHAAQFLFRCMPEARLLAGFIRLQKGRHSE